MVGWHQQLPEFTQTHVHRVGDAIQPSHPVVPFSSCPQSLPADVQADCRKGRGTRDQIANKHWIIKKVPEKIYFFFIDYAKAFDSVDYNKLWKILKEMGIPDHLTCIQLKLDMEQHTGSK